MAKKAAKTLAARNTAILNRTRVLTIGFHLFYLTLRCLVFRTSLTHNSLLIWILLSLPSLFIQFQFERIGRPTFGTAPGELLRSGDDLEAQGLTEYMWDVLYWTYGCVALAAVLGDVAWWLWGVIPIYSVYLAYTTFMGARGGMQSLAGGTDSAGTPQAGSKRQQKMEKRGGQKQLYR